MPPAETRPSRRWSSAIEDGDGHEVTRNISLPQRPLGQLTDRSPTQFLDTTPSSPRRRSTRPAQQRRCYRGHEVKTDGGFPTRPPPAAAAVSTRHLDVRSHLNAVIADCRAQSRRTQTAKRKLAVTATRKSQARIPCAWVRRNVVQLNPPRGRPGRPPLRDCRRRPAGEQCGSAGRPIEAAIVGRRKYP